MRWMIFPLILLVGCGGSSRETFREKGLRLQEEGRLPAAARAYREAIDDDPEDARALFGLGTVYQEIGKPEKAREMYRKALEIREDPRAHINLAAILEDEGKTEEALRHLEKAVEIDEESAYPVCYRGFFHERRGDLEKAEADYRTGIENEPDAAIGHMRLGKLLGKTDRRDQAMGFLEKATHLDPTSLVAWRAVAELADEADDIPSAIRAYGRLATLTPDDLEVFLRLGDLHLRRGNPHLAADALRRARVLDPDDERGRALRIRAYTELIEEEMQDQP